MGRNQSPDGVSTYPADQRDLESYGDASRALSQLQSPVLVHVSNPRERLYIAAFDGTGNNMYKERLDQNTNVALLYKQIKEQQKQRPHIGGDYVPGPGTTQESAAGRLWDLARGGSYERNLEEMYWKFANQAKKWVDEDPHVQIRLADIGFSRGAEQAAGFARLVHERGIPNPVDARVRKDSSGHITHVEYTKPPLVPPGRVIQAVALLDPVGTGAPELENRSLPPTVVSGLQITAEDERRDQFKSTNIIEPGFTEQRHFLNVTVGGAHCDVGGSYKLNGLAIRSGNLMVDAMNSWSDRPFLRKAQEPTDPQLNVVHRSEEHRVVYTTGDFDKRHGRVHVEQIDNPALCQMGIKRDCWDKAPRDTTLDRHLELRPVPIAPVVPAPPAIDRPSVWQAHEGDVHPSTRAPAGHALGRAPIVGPGSTMPLPDYVPGQFHGPLRAPQPHAVPPDRHTHGEPRANVHQQRIRGPFDDPNLDLAYHALMTGNDALLSQAARQVHESPEGQRMLQQGQELLGQHERRQAMEMTQVQRAPGRSR